MTTLQISPCTIVAGIAPAPVVASSKPDDLKPTNSIMSAVATAWDLDVRRRAAKVGVKDAGREKRQTNREPRLQAIGRVRDGGLPCLNCGRRIGVPKPPKGCLC